MQSLAKYCTKEIRNDYSTKPSEVEATINHEGWQENWEDDEEDYKMFRCPPRTYLAEPLHQEYGFCLCVNCKHSDAHLDQ